MIFNEARPHVETSGQFDEKLFSIGDLGMVFDILRNKLYSNPILAVCREISCNARDAMREAHRGDLPIEIHLPSDIEPFFSVKDTGVGISPDRMEHIFIRYGTSTKRNDNIQIGAYGLGCKTPYSISDTYTVITTYNGIKYNYACYIDETKVGKIALFSSEETDDCNGTEIIVPVQKKDYAAFAEATELATRYWDLKPIIKGPQITYQVPQVLIKGDNWAFTKKLNYYDKGLSVVIDGILYNISPESISSDASSKMYNISCNITMFFNIGELSLSANREQIYFDDLTKKRLYDRLIAVLQSALDIFQTKIESFDNLYDAEVFFLENFSRIFGINSFGKLHWRNIELSNSLRLGCNVFTTTKFTSTRQRKARNSYSKMHNTIFQFTDNCENYINDLDVELQSVLFKNRFETCPNLSTIQVICPNEKFTTEVIEKQFNTYNIKLGKLSTIVTVKKQSNRSTLLRLNIYKYDLRSSKFHRSSYSAFEEDTNDKILCPLTKTYTDYFVNGVPTGHFDSLLSMYNNISVYGISDQIPLDKLKGCYDFNTYIKDKVLSNSQIDFIKCKIAIRNSNSRSYNYYKLSNIKNKNSPFLKRAKLVEEFDKLKSSSGALLGFYEKINGEISEKDIDNWISNNKDFDYQRLTELCDKKYPMLNEVSTYRPSYDIFVDYINLVDSFDEKKEEKEKCLKLVG